MVENDFLIRCPGPSSSIHNLQLALDGDRVLGSFQLAGAGFRAFRINGNNLKLIEPLPGTGFAGQAVDGTMYRTLDGPGYLYNDGNDWVEVEVPNLPTYYDSFHGFRVRPDGAGGLRAGFRTGTQSGAYRFATATDGVWSWISLGSWDPNTVDEYVGVDAWDRPHSLIHTLDWETGPQMLLRFSHWGATPVGSSGGVGRVANPPRPELGGEIPIAVLRATDERLQLLAIVDGENWSEVDIPETEPHPDVCPRRYFSPDDECPPCVAQTTGVEDEAFQLARTSGGQLWAAWLVSEAQREVEYTASPFGSGFRCTGTAQASATGILHLVELAADGTSLRSLELPLGDIGSGGSREMAIAAYGQRVAVLFPGQHHGAVPGEVAARVMVFDTSEIE